jgi:hypothetical protein
MAKKRGARSQQNITQKLLRAQREDFIKKFGREPGPDDPVFFDPNKDVPAPLNARAVDQEIVDGMKAANLPPQFIYAYEKTGYILMNGQNYARVIREEYQAAIDEYFFLKDIGRLRKDK